MSEIIHAIQKDWTERVKGDINEEIFNLRYLGGGVALEPDEIKRLNYVRLDPELQSTNSHTPYSENHMDGWAADNGETSAK